VKLVDYADGRTELQFPDRFDTQATYSIWVAPDFIEPYRI